MEPIGPLMWEHRTIERAVALLEQELRKMRSDSELNPGFLRLAIDFFRTYADRIHHGKEEDILFSELSKKSLSGEHRNTMNELILDHVRARELVKQISDGMVTYTEKPAKGLDIVTKAVDGLLRLYPQHIEKEDKHFFYPVMDYFTNQGKREMLYRFSDFDSQLIHERYKAVLEDMGRMV